MSEFDFERIKDKAIEQLKAGKPLLGKDGAFAPLLESILNAALEGEMDAHLNDEERLSGNRRNGKMQEQVQTFMGEVTVSTPRDPIPPLIPNLSRSVKPFLPKASQTVSSACMRWETVLVKSATGWKRILATVFQPKQSALSLIVFFPR